ncbi:MAG TPA: tRNA pseudouridine(38-40) synthase TruA [Bryobacteraceae bacterium]|nr:tRNA pseudouridine(38-40) synthase TruA [Bryobacteraceae bacterium]
MRRVKIIVSYDGTGFHGWQVQPGLPTIQGVLEAVVSEIEGDPVKVEGSGRTDAGVHALAQVAAFSIGNPIPLANLKKAMNRLLPAAIRVVSADEAAADFHPRFQAHSKRYEYRIYRGETCPPFERLYSYHYPYPLQVQRMVELAPLFEGEHDFSAFAASDEKDELGGSKVRTIFLSRVSTEAERLTFRVQGSGFLKHMVRNLAGTLIEAGKGNLGAVAIKAFLDGHAPGKAGPSLPPHGLFLVSVEYRPEPEAC